MQIAMFRIWAAFFSGFCERASGIVGAFHLEIYGLQGNHLKEAASFHLRLEVAGKHG